MYKNIRKCLAIGTLSIICLLQVGCGPGTFNPPRYYNSGYMPYNYTPYYVGTSGYYWATPNNRYWNSNYYHNGYYGGHHGGYYWGSPNNRYWNNNYYHGGYYHGGPVGYYHDGHGRW